MSIDSAVLHTKLKEFFGFDSFKADQERIIKHLVDKNNAFVLMPTGGKKVKIEADNAAIREALEKGEKLKYAYLGERGEHIKIG